MLSSHCPLIFRDVDEDDEKLNGPFYCGILYQFTI